ncbi:MAG: polysaccharide deacetylase family protein, partial [Clostridia bacterium]
VSKVKTIFSCCIVFLLVLGCCLGMTNQTVQSVYNNKPLRKIPVYNVERSDKKVALTFDAAWGADKTQGIIDILNKYNVKGTFFLVGFWVDKYPEMVKAISDSGFDIGNHSKCHLHMPTLSVGEITKEIEYVNAKVKDITGKQPKFFRAPFGDYNNQLLECLEEQNMIGIQWNIDSLDWKGLGADEILARTTAKTRDGSIILFHNNSDHILDALPLVITTLLNKGFVPTTLSDLVYQDNYTIDNNGAQHRKI